MTLSGIKGKLENELQKDVDIIHGPLFNESLLKPNKVIELYERPGFPGEVLLDYGM